MVNAYILYIEWLKIHGVTPISQTKFRLNVVKQLVATTGEDEGYNIPLEITEVSRLSGKHFLQKIPCSADRKQLTRGCKVCNEGEQSSF